MVLVFKTSVQNKEEMLRVVPSLKKVLPHGNWNFDLDDCDRILRVETEQQVSGDLIDLLKKEGFDCEELQD